MVLHKDVFSEIVKFINDPKTFLSCLCVNKLFNCLCGKIIDVKKKEFTKTINDILSINKIPFKIKEFGFVFDNTENINVNYKCLPDGSFHGTYKLLFNRRYIEIEFNNGVCENISRMFVIDDIFDVMPYDRSPYHECDSDMCKNHSNKYILANSIDIRNPKKRIIQKYYKCGKVHYTIIDNL